MQDNPLYNPQFLAGLAMMRGAAPHEALANAALQQRQQEQLMQQQQQAHRSAQQQQVMQQQLPEIFNQLRGKDPYEQYAILTKLGLDPQQASSILKTISAATPKDSAQENIVFNPVTGEAMQKRIENGKVTGFNLVEPGNPNSLDNMQPQVLPNGTADMAIGNNPTVGNKQDFVEGYEPPVKKYETPVEAKERRKSEEETLKEFQQSSIKATQTEHAIESLEKSLAKFNTGSTAGFRKSYAKLEKGLFGTDILGISPEDAENIESKGAELVMPLVERNKGAASDKDMELFLKAVPNVHNTPEGNTMILEAAKALNLRNKQRFAAAKAYQRKFGTIDGFIEKWTGYVNNNSLFTEEKGGPLNKKNISNWKTDILGEPSDEKSKENARRAASDYSNEELLAIAR